MRHPSSLLPRGPLCSPETPSPCTFTPLISWLGGGRDDTTLASDNTGNLESLVGAPSRTLLHSLSPPLLPSVPGVGRSHPRTHTPYHFSIHLPPSLSLPCPSLSSFVYLTLQVLPSTAPSLYSIVHITTSTLSSPHHKQDSTPTRNTVVMGSDGSQMPNMKTCSNTPFLPYSAGPATTARFLSPGSRAAPQVPSSSPVPPPLLTINFISWKILL